ncbi:hypothetical protein ACIQZM_17690 [Peribacillus sp. NPDC097206]|uniref:hypothetical protein n=1 Tax=Peribacillus sp. NPDC097206 TaxID=3364398 RepID=UPI00382BBE99
MLNYLTEILAEKKVDSAYLSTERGEGKPEMFFTKNGYTTSESRVLMTMKIC